MPRVARIVIAGQPHHVTQRGNNRQDVFFVDDDRRVYLELLLDHAQQFGFSVLGYCLMTNHVHVVGTPEREDSLAKAIGRTNFRYTQYINRLHGRSGHLWQNRFFSCALDEVHCWRTMAYVERNPVRAKKRETAPEGNAKGNRKADKQVTVPCFHHVFMFSHVFQVFHSGLPGFALVCEINVERLQT